jgi:diguanylate cyclase (GGDEF)-like protein/PAS domain S-box-containing protein
VDKSVAADTGNGADGDEAATDGQEGGPARSVPLDVLPDAALLIDGAGTVIAANEAVSRLFGHDPTGDALTGLLHQTELPAGADAPIRLRVQGRHGDDVPFIADISVADSDVAPGHRLVLLRELDTGLLIEESRRLLDLAFVSAPIGMAFFNPEGEYIRVNPALCRLLDRAPEGLIGHRDQEFTHPEDRASDVAAAWRILEGEIDAWQTEKRFVRPDGSIVWAIANMTFLRDEARRPVAWLGQFQDITDRKSLEDRLRQLADEDPLTSLPNRRSIEAAVRLSLELSARHQIAGSLLMIDLDGFKVINDTHGHATGDAALAAVAGALRTRLRATDLLARVGGDEYAVLLRATAGTRAQKVADALEACVRKVRLEPGQPGIELSASVGVADFGTDPLPTVEELFAAADTAMYAAKRRARENAG